MRILIAVSSKHGGTYGIGTRLRTELLDRGHDAAIMTIDGNRCPDGYDAYVVGSAVYTGKWMKPAREFVHDNLATLRSKPLWLFSSGPLGDHPDPERSIDHPDEIATVAGAREHHVFSGRLLREELGPVERVAAAVVHAPEGDFRDWAEIDEWADHIDEELRGLVST